MAANTVNGGGNGARSGAQTLLLLAPPLNVAILRALADGPRQQAELRREAGSPAQTTLRAQLRRLAEIGAVERRRRNRFPGVVEYELNPSGRDLLFVVDVLDRWLDRAPDGPLSLGDGGARAAIKALAEGWSTTMLRALAAGPLSLTELDGLIVALSYPSLERRLAAMRLADLVERCAGSGRGTPHAVTAWAREGVAPLVAAARWEQDHLPSRAAIARLDAEAAFLLAVPLLRLRSDVSGSGRMAAAIRGSDGPRPAGVTVAVEKGEIVSCTTRLGRSADAWALGSPAAWLDAVTGSEANEVVLGGKTELARALLSSLRKAYSGFQAANRSRP